jgi:hypothetical protein
MRVTNVNGSSVHDIPTGYASWLSYWESYEILSDDDIKCYACDEYMTRDDLVGAHVRKPYSSDKKWYIIPLCRPCNGRKGNFDVNPDYLVPTPSRSR